MAAPRRGGGDHHDQGMGLLTRKPLRERLGVARLLRLIGDEFWDRPQPPGPLWPKEKDEL
jgi:hypothetical protein